MSGIMLNWDDSAFFYYIHKGYGKKVNDRQSAVSCCEAVINQYQGTNVTDFLMCVNARLASYPSVTIENYGDAYNRKVQNGEEVDFSETWVSSFNKVYNEWGIDYFQIWINRLNEINIKPWISIRMNDAHETLSKTSFLAPDFYYNNPQYRRVTYNPVPSYFDGLYDYGQIEIRERFLDFIDETLSRYDVFGLELDWMREAFLFKNGMECEGISILTDFMKNVKAIVEKYERKRNHRILISVRVPSGVETCYYLGFDVAGWAKLGLINNVVITPRWSTTDTDMPVEIWKNLLNPYEVTIAAGIEVLIRQNRKSAYTYNCIETVYANSSAYFSAGADKFYLFNFMAMPDLFGADSENTALYSLYKDLKDIFIGCSDLEHSIKRDRRHFVTFKDLTASWEKSEYYVPVECNKEKTEPEIFRIRTGKTDKHSIAYIQMGIESNDVIYDEDICIYINSQQISGLKKVDEPDYYIRSGRYICKIPDIDMINNINIVQAWSRTKTFTITHIEIIIKRKDNIE